MFQEVRSLIYYIRVSPICKTIFRSNTYGYDYLPEVKKIYLPHFL